MSTWEHPHTRPPKPTGTSSPSSRADAEPRRILVVAAEPPATFAAPAGPGVLAHACVDPLAAPVLAREHRVTLVLLDGSLPAEVRAQAIAAVKTAQPCVCATVLAEVTARSLADAIETGSDTILVRPIEVGQVQRMLARERPTAQRAHLDGSGFEMPALGGCSTPMEEVWRLVALAAHSDASVLVTGETGVGKEVVARSLHRLSARRLGPFIAVNCAALPQTLLEAELFGHEKGAFTGATERHRGRFELAHGGTLFLDEIGELPVGVQVKLLRVLQERQFERVGGSSSIAVDVRIIAATNRSIAEESRRGRFRADLFYRLNVLSIEVPPLRQRHADILPLWEQFVGRGAKRDGRPPPQTSLAVKRRLLQHDWPGNVRELENAALHALTVTAGQRIMPADLPVHIGGGSAAHNPEAKLVGQTLRQVERSLIVQTVEALGCIKSAAEMLGISTRKIHYRLKEYRTERLLTAPPSPVEPSRARVLLAEDDDELRWALAELLRGSGYDVTPVANGKALLEHLGSALLMQQNPNPSDVIITDIRMPGLSGLQLLEGMRSQKGRIPVIVMSAFADDETRERVLSMGAAAFLEKPIDHLELARAIDHACSPDCTATA
jgi:DNA-binding NtrC family response regulator